MDVEEGGGDPGLPPGQPGRQAQRLLVVLLGGYWLNVRQHLPSAAIVRLMEELSVSASATRTALSRLTRRGLLIASKQGRTTHYGLSSDGMLMFADSAPRLFRSAHAHESWDGLWTIFAFSIPNPRQDTRAALRSALRWNGFAPLYDGLWVSPWDKQNEISHVVKDLALENFTIIRGTELELGMTSTPLASAFELAELNDRYEQFVRTYAPLRVPATAGEVPPRQALIQRTQMTQEWSRLVTLDPQLPVEAVPMSRNHTDAHDLFSALFDSLGPAAEARFRQIVSEHSPALAALVSHHRSDLQPEFHYRELANTAGDQREVSATSRGAAGTARRRERSERD